MAVNFRLAYKDGESYTDLFPKTSMEAIKNATKALKYSKVNVIVPPYSQTEQILDLSLTSSQQRSPFFVELVNKDRSALRDYSSISQIETRGSQLIINRLFYYPRAQIEINLIFREGGNV